MRWQVRSTLVRSRLRRPVSAPAEAPPTTRVPQVPADDRRGPCGDAAHDAGAAGVRPTPARPLRRRRPPRGCRAVPRVPRSAPRTAIAAPPTAPTTRVPVQAPGAAAAVPPTTRVPRVPCAAPRTTVAAPPTVAITRIPVPAPVVTPPAPAVVPAPATAGADRGSSGAGRGARGCAERGPGVGRRPFLRRPGCRLDGDGPVLRAGAEAGRRAVGVDQGRLPAHDDRRTGRRTGARRRCLPPCPPAAVRRAPRVRRGARGGAGCGAGVGRRALLRRPGCRLDGDGPVLRAGAEAGRPAVGVDQGRLPAHDDRRTGRRTGARRRARLACAVRRRRRRSPRCWQDVLGVDAGVGRRPLLRRPGCRLDGHGPLLRAGCASATTCRRCRSRTSTRTRRSTVWPPRSRPPRRPRRVAAATSWMHPCRPRRPSGPRRIPSTRPGRRPGHARYVLCGALQLLIFLAYSAVASVVRRPRRRVGHRRRHPGGRLPAVGGVHHRDLRRAVRAAHRGEVGADRPVAAAAVPGLEHAPTSGSGSSRSSSGRTRWLPSSARRSTCCTCARWARRSAGTSRSSPAPCPPARTCSPSATARSSARKPSSAATGPTTA